MYLDSTSFFQGTVVEFQKPIYAVKVSGFRGCLVDIELTYPGSNPFFPEMLTNEERMNTSKPMYKFELKISFYSDCDVDTLLVQLAFGHHLSGVELDFGVDGKNEWEFIEPAFGYFGLQNSFYEGEVNGISQGANIHKLKIDPISGEVIGGFFLIPKHANIQYFDVLFSDNDIYNGTNPSDGFGLSLVAGSSVVELDRIANDDTFYLKDTGNTLSIMIPTLQTILSDTNTSVIKTDNSGIEWVRVGFLINQTNTPGGASVNVQDLKVLYELEHKIGQTDEFASYLREFVAVNNQGASQSNSGQILIPIETRSRKWRTIILE